MSSFVLFIFEGKKAEPNIADNLTKFFICNDNKVVLRTTYGTSIYSLAKKIAEDPYLETYELIVEEINKKTEISDADKKILNIGDYNEISDIYLFFDYDCHCSNANDEHLDMMLEHFNDAQDKGLLCVSYPMVEAIRHQYSADFHEAKHSVEDLTGYKKFLSSGRAETDHRYFNWGLYDKDVWKEITNVNLARANNLVFNRMEFPEEQIDQKEIFTMQLEKHKPQLEVQVLSSFPFMLHHFYGEALQDQFE